MNIILNGKDISSSITNATISGERRSCCRTLDIGLLNNPMDTSITPIDINIGDNIILIKDNITLFYGVVWRKQNDSNSKEISIHCKDLGIYLLKNKYSYKFKNLSADEITKKVCRDFDIPIGNLVPAGTISRTFLGTSLYEIIMSSYSLSGNEKYDCYFKGDKLHVEKRGILESKELSLSLMSTSVSESLDNMVNVVNVFDKDGNKIDSFENSEDKKMFGVISEHVKVQEGESYAETAKKKLSRPAQKIVVTNLGDTSYRTGKYIIVSDAVSNIQGKFFIDSDQHNFKNGVYTNKLTLNFENIMDSHDSGRDPDE